MKLGRNVVDLSPIDLPLKNDFPPVARGGACRPPGPYVPLLLPAYFFWHRRIGLVCMRVCKLISRLLCLSPLLPPFLQSLRLCYSRTGSPSPVARRMSAPSSPRQSTLCFLTWLTSTRVFWGRLRRSSASTL